MTEAQDSNLCLYCGAYWDCGHRRREYLVTGDNGEVVNHITTEGGLLMVGGGPETSRVITKDQAREWMSKLGIDPDVVDSDGIITADGEMR